MTVSVCEEMFIQSIVTMFTLDLFPSGPAETPNSLSEGEDEEDEDEEEDEFKEEDEDEELKTEGK